MSIKSIKKKILNFIAPFLVYFLSKMLYLTCKNTFLIDDKARDNNFIASLWHGNFLMMPFLYKKIRFNKINLTLITSMHNDGNLVEKYFKYFGFTSIRGSTNKGGARVIINSINELKKGADLAITPDGPKGPYKNIADGILLIAIKSQKPICVCKIISSKCWTLKTWDKFMIPKPFSEITYYISPPIYFEKNIDLKTAKEILQNAMEVDIENIKI